MVMFVVQGDGDIVVSQCMVWTGKRSRTLISFTVYAFSAYSPFSAAEILSLIYVMRIVLRTLYCRGWL